MPAEIEPGRRDTLTAPREDGAVLFDPPPSAVDGLLTHNAAQRRGWSCVVAGRSLAELAQLARRELLSEAAQYTRQYRDVAVPAAPTAVLAAGHQPGLFHAGVWAKNFALANLAAPRGATAVNLVVDNDTCKQASVTVPTGTVRQPLRTQVAFDAPAAETPWEDRPVAALETARRFPDRVRHALGSLVSQPLLDGFWPSVMELIDAGANWSTALAQARHRREGHWGVHTLELPQSRVCQFQATRWLMAHLLAQAARFREVHNAAVAGFRRAHRLRSANHPFPDLEADGLWTEAPFWKWTAADPRRRRLFVRGQADRLLLTDRQGWDAELCLGPAGRAAEAVEQLAAWERQGIKLRTRALTTTLVARLLLCDVFIHGLGGGEYDAVTDRVIRDFFGVDPPGFLIVTGTLHLPLGSAAEIAADRPRWTVQECDRRLRELDYHPEMYLAEVPGLLPDESAAAQRIAAKKAGWVASSAERPHAKTRCRGIRAANEALRPVVAPLRAEYQRQRLLAAQWEATEMVRRDREYPFCLYPEKKLRNFLLEIGRESG